MGEGFGLSWGTALGFLSCVAAASTSNGTCGARPVYWPKRPTFKYQEPTVEIVQGLGNHLVTRSAISVLERIYHQNGLRQAGREEEPAMVYTHIEGLDPVLKSLEQDTRSTSCPGLSGIASKKLLRHNLAQFEEVMGRSSAQFLPRAWNVPQEMQKMRDEHDGWLMLRDANSHFANNVHIVHTNWTRGIQEIIDGGSKTDWIAIQYIMPQLWSRRKWDFRVHVLMTGHDPMRVFLGGPELVFARRAMKDFTFEDRSIRVHTTNMQYDAAKDENPFRPFENSKKFFPDGGWEKMWDQVRAIVQRTLLAVEPRVRDRGKMLMRHSDQCFEMLGYDFYPDADGKIYLLEVNRNPDPGYVFAHLQGAVKTQVVHDMLCVVGASCMMASKAPIMTLPEEEKIFLEPFEFTANPKERLFEDHNRYIKRAARTNFEMIWPPNENDKEGVDFARQLMMTEEWGPSYYGKMIWPASARKGDQMPRETGFSNGRFIQSA